MAYAAGTPWWRRAHFYAVVLCSGFALCTMVLTLPDMAANFFGGGPDACLVPSSDRCRAARSSAAVAIGASQASKAFLGFAMGPTLGALSDARGRRFFLIGAQGVALVSYAALVLSLYGWISFWFFLVLNGLTGLVPLTPALLAVVIDGVPQDGRASAVGLLLACYEIAVIVGPVLGSHLSLPSTASLACAGGAAALALSAAYGESLPPEHRLPPRGAAETAGAQWWRPDRALSIINSSSLFRRLSFVVFLSTMVLTGVQQVFLLFLETAYGLQRAEAGVFLSLWAISGLAIQVLVLPALVRYTGLARTVLLGLAFQMVQSGLLAFLRTRAAVAASCVFGGFGSVVFPAISAMKANAARESEQGRVQGAVSGLQQFATGVGPLSYGAIFGLLAGSKSPVGSPAPQGIFVLSLAVLVPTVAVAASLCRSAADGGEGSMDSSLPMLRRRVSACRGWGGGRHSGGAPLAEGGSLSVSMAPAQAVG